MARELILIENGQISQKYENVGKEKQLPKLRSAASNTRNTNYKDLARSRHLWSTNRKLNYGCATEYGKSWPRAITKLVSELSVDDDSNYEDDCLVPSIRNAVT